jgi:hypothetical protein
MLGQASRGSRGGEYLVIELKAPRVRIGHKEVGQVKSYAEAVASDSQFADADVQWDFWVISTGMGDVVRKDASQPNEPPRNRELGQRAGLGQDLGQDRR